MLLWSSIHQVDDKTNIIQPIRERKVNMGPISVFFVQKNIIKWKHFPHYWPFVRGIHWSPVYYPQQKPVMRSFDIFFDLSQNERMSKQSWGWWFETPSCSLLRHCNDNSNSMELSFTLISILTQQLLHYFIHGYAVAACEKIDRKNLIASIRMKGR